MAISTYAYARYNIFSLYLTFYIISIVNEVSHIISCIYYQNLTCIFLKCKLSDGTISKLVQIYYKEGKDSIPYIAIFNVHLISFCS